MYIHNEKLFKPYLMIFWLPMPTFCFCEAVICKSMKFFHIFFFNIWYCVGSAETLFHFWYLNGQSKNWICPIYFIVLFLFFIWPNHWNICAICFEFLICKEIGFYTMSAKIRTLESFAQRSKLPITSVSYFCPFSVSGTMSQIW